MGNPEFENTPERVAELKSKMEKLTATVKENTAYFSNPDASLVVQEVPGITGVEETRKYREKNAAEKITELTQLLSSADTLMSELTQNSGGSGGYYELVQRLKTEATEVLKNPVTTYQDFNLD